MYRVVALGFWAGDIVDRLRHIDAFEDIKFVYCDTNEERYTCHGTANDRHVLLENFDQCHEALHEDCDHMAVLVADFSEECARKYAVDIMYELWGHADYAYFFGVMPFWAGHMREKAEPVLRDLREWSNLSVIQDELKRPEDVFFAHMNDGIARLISLVLKHPYKEGSDDRDELPFGVLVTPEQLRSALQDMCANNKYLIPYCKAGTFSFYESTSEY